MKDSVLTSVAKRLLEDLETAARARTLRMTYSRFSDLVGIRPMYYVKYLDAVAEYQRAQQIPLPDLTYILVNKDFHYPSQIGGHLAKPPNAAQKKLAFEEMQKVIEHYCPGAKNPYPQIQ